MGQHEEMIYVSAFNVVKHGRAQIELISSDSPAEEEKEESKDDKKSLIKNETKADYHKSQVAFLAELFSYVQIVPDYLDNSRCTVSLKKL